MEILNIARLDGVDYTFIDLSNHVLFVELVERGDISIEKALTLAEDLHALYLDIQNLTLSDLLFSCHNILAAYPYTLGEYLQIENTEFIKMVKANL